MSECLENILEHYNQKSLDILFPKYDAPLLEKIIIYFINIVHIVGLYYIIFGLLFTPSKYMHVYIIYVLTIILLYIFLNNKCFMNDMAHKNSSNEEFKQNFSTKAGTINCVNSITHLKMKTIYKSLVIFLILGCLSFVNKKYSISNGLYNMVNKIENFSKLFHYMPLIILYSFIIFYLLKYKFFN